MAVDASLEVVESKGWHGCNSTPGRGMVQANGGCLLMWGVDPNSQESAMPAITGFVRLSGPVRRVLPLGRVLWLSRRAIQAQGADRKFAIKSEGIAPKRTP